MTRTRLGRTLVGAALTLMLSAVGLAPASADTPTAPVITWVGVTADASYPYGEVPEASCTVDDVTMACAVSGYDTTLGTHMLTASVTLIADPSQVVASEQISYTVTSWYTFRGFYKPVRMDKVNTVKAGRTVPLKFKVYQAGTKVKSADVVTSIMAQPADCTAFTATGDPAVSVTANHKGLRLKYRDGAFHQNWKTSKLPKPAKVKVKVKARGKTRTKTVTIPLCYIVTATMNDTSTLSANFKLR